MVNSFLLPRYDLVAARGGLTNEYIPFCIPAPTLSVYSLPRLISDWIYLFHAEERWTDNMD